MNGPYALLVAQVAAYVPPLDRDGFLEVLEVLNARVTEIQVRPRKSDLRLALEALCRARANTRFAELGLKTRF